MANILSFLIPSEKKFFPMFEQASGNLKDISKSLVKMVEAPTPEGRKEYLNLIVKQEHIGDQISHSIFNELSATFITPFDREDIYKLVSSLDDIVDYIHGAGKRIDLYNIDEIHPSVIKLAELVEKAAADIHDGICALRDLKNVDKIKEICVRVNSIENHADDIFDMSIGQLFEEEKDAIKIIKTKEILSAVETASDKCEDVTNVLEQILLKSS